MSILSARQLDRVRSSALPPAVVIGADITGLTEARALRDHGVPVFAIDSVRRRFTGYSDAFDLLVFKEFWGPPLIPFLEQLAAELPQKAALFISMDEPVKVVGSLGQHLRELYHFEFPDAGDVTTLMNKGAFTELALQRGWPVPRTRDCRSREEVEAAARTLTFPVIVKPRVKNVEFRKSGNRKASRCDTVGELMSEYQKMAQWEAEAVVQEFVPGGDDEIYFSFHYLDASLQEVCSFEGRKLRQWVPECGNTAMAIGVERPRVHALTREILTSTRCVGFGAVEYKRDPRTDSFVIMEPTVGRVNLQVGTAIANNVDIVSRAYFHLVGRPYPGGGPVTHDRKWLIARSDYRSARYWMRKGELTWGGYLRSLRGPKRFAVWRLSDRGMMAGALAFSATMPLRLLRRVARRLVRGSAAPRTTP
ncbi:MAG: hypothetical protein M3373_12420 [Gemmatimonadota bacterium]|nr:hypothetical protein [Gemmatimonadota bacterium]